MDRTVYEILCDYQDGENGGNGYIRFINFDENSNTMNIKTYSPKLDDYNFYDNSEKEKNSLGYKDEFTIPLNLNKRAKVLATDSFILEGNKAEASVNEINKDKNLEVPEEKIETAAENKEAAVQDKGSYKLYSNIAKTGDLYIEMIFIILAFSGAVIVSEIEIRKAKKIKN